MRHKFSIYLFLLFFFNGTINAQPLSAYVNVKGEFYSFDGSTKGVQQLDFLTPGLYKTGKSLIAFIDNAKNFKVYQFGRVSKLNDGYTTDFSVSRNLLLIKNQAALYVYDNGLLKLLSAYSTNSTLGDSLIGFYDDRALAYRLYTNGHILTLEENSVEFPLKMYAIGSNIFAYVNNNDDFKIWYQGDIIEQESSAPTRVLCGRNIVPYIDHYGTFRIFYKGETTDAESFAPHIIKVGDDLVAYINNLNELRIFYNGQMYETNVRHPKYFNVSHNLVVFDNGSGGLSVFYKGEITQLENFIPTNIQTGDNTLLYFDQANQLKVFSFGTQETLPNDNYTGTVLDWDVVQLKTGFDEYHFYYKGKIY